jgi:adenylosuccinate synthase
MGDLRDLDRLESKLATIVDYKNKVFTALYHAEPMSSAALFEKCRAYAARLLPFVVDTTEFMHKAIAEGKSILFEGAQGTMLDIDHGTYPFVTSSTTVSCNAASGSGVNPLALEEVFGVVKAYTTRVGEGPFPTELNDALGKAIAEKGGEFGTTTGRARRCGWLDLVITKHASALSGFTGVAMTKIDVLGGVGDLKVCTHYSLDGKKVCTIPAGLEVLGRCEPRYKTLKGWDDLEPARLEKILSKGFSALPEDIRKYVRFVEKEMGVPVILLGLGRRRNEIIDMRRKRWGKK